MTTQVIILIVLCFGIAGVGFFAGYLYSKTKLVVPEYQEVVHTEVKTVMLMSEQRITRHDAMLHGEQAQKLAMQSAINEIHENINAHIIWKEWDDTQDDCFYISATLLIGKMD